MKRKVFSLLILFFLLTSACTRSFQSKSNPTEQPVSTVAITISQPDTPVPTNLPGCTSLASFVADVTIPDNSVIEAGAPFTKTWRVKNTGACHWDSGYSLVFVSGEQMGTPDSIPLEVVESDTTVDITLEMTAPSSVGNYSNSFELQDPSGEIIPIDDGQYLWTIITVVSGGDQVETASEGEVTAAPASSGRDSGAACAYLEDQVKVTDVIRAINTYRSRNGLPGYSVNPLLTQAARAHSADMACNQLFFHNGSNGSTPAARVAAAGYVASSVTENLYSSSPPLSGVNVVAWWATDQGDGWHNENLLSTKFTEIGVAYTYFNDYGYYVVVFAVP